MDIRKFWKDVLEQNEEKLSDYFHKDALIRWHCSNELFTVSEYIREIERIEETDDKIITAVKVFPADKSSFFHVVSFFRIENELIEEMDEYWADDSEVPEWRRRLELGRKIIS